MARDGFTTEGRSSANAPALSMPSSPVSEEQKLDIVHSTAHFPKVSVGDISWFEWQFIILGGLVVLLPLLFLLGEPALAGKNPIEFYFWMGATLSAPHVFCTYLRLGRKIDEKRVSWIWGFPAYGLLALIIGIGAYANLYTQIMTFVNLWQSYHYARQVYGVSRIYSRKNLETGLITGLSFFAYQLALPLFVFGRWSMLFDAWHGKASDVIIPFHVDDRLMTCFAVLAGLGLVFGLYAEFLKTKSAVYNPVGLVNLGVFYFIHWFGFLSITYYQRGFFAVTMFHAIQYMALLWWFERKARDHSQASFIVQSNPNPFFGNILSGERAPLRRSLDLVREFVITGPVLHSFFLFWLLSFLFTWVVMYQGVPQLSYIWVWLGTVLLGAQSAHHYVIDTVLWRRTTGQ